MNFKLSLLALTLFTLSNTRAMDQDPHGELQEYAQENDEAARACIIASIDVLIYAGMVRDQHNDSDYRETAYKLLLLSAEDLKTLGVDTIHASANNITITPNKSLGYLYPGLFNGKKTLSIEDVVKEARAYVMPHAMDDARDTLVYNVALLRDNRLNRSLRHKVEVAQNAVAAGQILLNKDIAYISWHEDTSPDRRPLTKTYRQEYPEIFKWNMGQVNVKKLMYKAQKFLDKNQSIG